MAWAVLDVSKWDGYVDFEAWKSKHDLWGVIIKAGGNEGGRYSDAWFERHYNDAKAAGLHVGAYYYTVCTDTSTARGDADHFAGLLRGKSFDLPVYMDVEDRRQYALSRRSLTDVIKAFCDRLNDLGYYSGIYVNGSTWLNNVNRNELLQYADWIAWWQRDWPEAAGDIGMWQQGTKRLSDGAVYYDDVSGCTDFNWCCVDYPSRISGGGDTPDPEPTPTPDPEPPVQLAVDGWIGELSTTEWQKQCGTYVDGVISGQDHDNQWCMERLVSVEWDEYGSQLVKVIQRKVGTDQDGIIGPNTVKGIQTFLNRIGSYGLDVDGYFGSHTAEALQKSLNENRWR